MPSTSTHPSLKRLYEAAKNMRPPVSGKSAVAKWLNVSPQIVNHWEKRGVSRDGALAAQKKSGYSATWILTGDGEERITSSASSPPAGPLAARLKQEQEIDPYEVLERALSALVIVGKQKEVVLDQVRVFAEQSKATQRAWQEAMGRKAKE